MARPTTPLLSLEKITGAALELVDTTGELTMAQLARALGVRPSSLYHHVAGREAIIEAVRAAVFTEQHLDLDADAGTNGGTNGEQPVEESLHRLLHGYRDAFARHPRLIPVLTAHTVAAPEVLAIYSTLATLLARWGVPDEHLLDAVTILDCFVIGAALDVTAPEQVWAPSGAESPALSRALAAAPQGRDRADQSFELGLRVVLGGLATLRP